ncbi:MAG: glycosyltransferase family 39 protein [Deltaproteobacteria bacterium]|nr:glycosyltransferase family 39 protein [Deltaproteobacteria bacterium]
MRPHDEATSSAPKAPPRWLDWIARAGAPLLALITAVVIVCRSHWHFFRPWAVPLSNDEGYISALALRMLHGRWLPYVDGVSQRGPVLYWLTALAMKLGGEGSWLPIRWLALVLGLVLHGLVFALAWELFGSFAAAVAMLFTAYFVNYELIPWDGLGLNGEVLAMCFVLGSLLLAARAQRLPEARRRPWWLGLSGALAALAGLSKQMSLIHVVPTVCWLALGPEGAGPRSPGSRARDLGRYALGFAAPYSAVLAVFAATGHLKEFVYYYQRYGREIFMAPLTREFMRDKLREQFDRYFLGVAGFASVGILALARALREALEESVQARGAAAWAERARKRAGALFAVAQFTLGCVGACFTFRFFGHYFLQVHPLAAVVAAYAVSERFEPLEARRPGNVASAFVVVAGAAVLLGMSSSALTRQVLNRRETDRWYQDPQTDPIVRYVLEKTRPTDTLFVWGFRAETYLSSRRFPASRFVYSVYPAGVVPWMTATREEEERRQVPGARALLLEDLERWRPELVVDAGRSMSGRYMYNYPMLRLYLDRHYCFMRYVDGEPVYRRRHGETCPPADY